MDFGNYRVHGAVSSDAWAAREGAPRATGEEADAAVAVEVDWREAHETLDRGRQQGFQPRDYGGDYIAGDVGVHLGRVEHGLARRTAGLLRNRSASGWVSQS